MFRRIWLMKGDAEMTIPERQCDILIVGAGNAALSAAHAAVERGADVVVLEKAPRNDRGGNSMLTQGMRFAYDNPDELLALMKSEDATPEVRSFLDERVPQRSQTALWDEVMAVTGGMSDKEMLRIHVERSYETARWLHSKGHNWIPSYGKNVTGASGTTGNLIKMEGGGYGLQERNFTYLEKLPNVTFLYGTSATELLQDSDGSVAGVIALSGNGFEKIMANAVILASGGFGANAEMRARYLGPGWDTARNRGVPYNTGDGLRIALDIGAMPYGSWTTCHASPVDWDMPDNSYPSAWSAGHEDSWTRYVYPFAIMVNARGERFVDEADNVRGLTYAKMGRAILTQPAGQAFQIIDANVRNGGLVSDCYEGATGEKADTLEELAQKLGIDTDGLRRTVREFNDAVPQDREAAPSPFKVDGVGTVNLIPPKSNFAMRIDKPPFEGYAVRCGITFTYGGLRIDPQTAQVQHVAGQPITGLYAAGEIVGGLWHRNYPSGGGMMAGSTFGRIAGYSAARRTSNP